MRPCYQIGEVLLVLNMPAQRMTFCRVLLFVLLVLPTWVQLVAANAKLSDMEPSSLDSTLSSIKDAKGRISRTTRRLAKSGQAVWETGETEAAGVRRFHSGRRRRSSDQCSQTCTHETNITCHVTKRSTMCIHKDESDTDFPNRPRNLNIEQRKVDNKVHFNITWKAPYDFSYKAVTGYELHISQFDRFISQPLVDCYFINLSTTDWGTVPNVHTVQYFLDCVWMHADHYRKLHVKIFSYPKLQGEAQEHQATEAWVSPEHVKLNNPSLEWSPSILGVQDMDNRSLLVTVKPLHPDIAYLKICVSHASSIPCLGRVLLMESPKNTLRYRVEGLAANNSYYIYVRPFNARNEELDVWLHKTNPVFLKPWPEAPATTTTTTTTQMPTHHPVKPPPVHSSGVKLDMVVILVSCTLLLLLVCIISGLFCWCRGYLQKILRVCLPQTAFQGPPVRVLQIHVKEENCPGFHELVKKHMEYLSEYLRLECVDCEDMRKQPNISQWLAQESTVLVYLSPQLTNQLLRVQDAGLGREGTLPNSCLAWKVDHIHRLAHSVAGRSWWNRKRAPVIFISPGCWFQDLDAELGRSATFKTLPRFSITSSPGPLLSELTGSLRGWLNTCRTASERRKELENIMNTLLQNIRQNQAHYPDGGQHLNGHAAKCGAEDYDYDDLEGKGHPYMGSTQGKPGQPHRTDSGFSSSTPDHHRGGSNSSSDHTSQGAERDGEEGVAETDPMIQGAGKKLSVSLLSVFLPPESVTEDVDSVVIFENMRKLNANCNWSS